MLGFSDALQAFLKLSASNQVWAYRFTSINLFVSTNKQAPHWLKLNINSNQSYKTAVLLQRSVLFFETLLYQLLAIFSAPQRSWIEPVFINTNSTLSNSTILSPSFPSMALLKLMGCRYNLEKYGRKTLADQVNSKPATRAHREGYQL